MKKIFICLITLSLLNTACHEASTVTKKDEGVAKVFYIPFEIDFYAGIPESQFEERADCISEIKVQDFKKLLIPTHNIYQMGNPRAKVIYKDNIYFIGQEGVVTNFKETFELSSIKDFEQVISYSLHPNPKNMNNSGQNNLCQPLDKTAKKVG